MKKKILIFLTTAICLTALSLGLSACGEKAHVHSYEESTVQPTCTEEGYTLYTCSCGESYRDNYIDALGHKLSHRQGREATCTSIGWKEYDTCSRCDYTTYEAIPALGHDSVYHEGKEATCTEIGWNEYDTCSRCDYTTYKEIPALGHNYTDGVCTACGAEYISEGLAYTLTGDSAGYIVSGIGTCTDTDLVIPSVRNGLPVTCIRNSAFYNCTGLTSITIPDSVTSIGDFAFMSCTGLTSITIPDSVTSIGGAAFSGCEKLKSNQYDNAYYLGNKQNACVVLIGAIADSITSCTIHPDTKVICDSAFENCTGLTNITIPDRVKSIGHSAFRNCTGLKSATIGNSVMSIGSYAFYDCTGLASVTVGDGVTRVGGSVFNNTAYYNDESNWENGVLYIGKHLIKAKTTLSGAYMIESGTLTIAGEAFYKCTELTGVTIPDGVKSVGNYAFYGCTGLTSITIPDSVTSIGFYAFSLCANLTSVTFQNANGWSVSESDSDTLPIITSISSGKLSNPAMASQTLRATYSKYYWKRS